MLESYIRTGDGKDYVDVDCVREALGIKEDEDIFLVIKKLKDERERYRSNCDYFAGIAQDRLHDRNKLELGLREALGTVDEYADILGLVRKLKQERDALKDQVRRLRIQANSIYGASCGYSEYSGDKAPAFLCNVISYSWGFEGGALRNGSIRVELDLTPNANYKGTFDMEDLKKYIQEYGRGKNKRMVEAADYENAKVARAELAYLYKTVLGKEKLDRDLSPHEIMKAILDEYKRVRDAQFASDQCLRGVYMHVHEGTDYKTSDIYAAPDKLADGIITRYNAARMLSRLETLREIDDHIDKLCDEYTIVQPDRKSTTKERLDYIFAVLDEHVERCDELDDFRVDICEVLGIDADELFGSPRQNDKYILEQVEKLLKESAGHDKLFRDSVCDALGTTTAVSDSYLFKKIEKLKLDHKEIQEKYSRYCLAVGSLCNIPAEHREDISWIEDAFDHTKKDYLKWKDDADRLARLRSNICSEIGMDYPVTNNDIVNRVKSLYDANESNNDVLSDLNRQVTELKHSTELLIEFRDDVAKAIGMDYPTTNNVILNNVQYIYKDREDAYGMVAKLNDQVTALEKAKEELQQQFEFQNGLRKQWHERYESEHERANGVQKCLDKTREALHVKDISLETAKKEYQKVCDNLVTAQAAIDGLKKKIRELQADTTEAGHPIDTDPGYLRAGEEDSEE